MFKQFVVDIPNVLTIVNKNKLESCGGCSQGWSL
jgi:hypothetical protein